MSGMGSGGAGGIGAAWVTAGGGDGATAGARFTGDPQPEQKF
jgi:hypothetical protein